MAKKANRNVHSMPPEYVRSIALRMAADAIEKSMKGMVVETPNSGPKEARKIRLAIRREMRGMVDELRREIFELDGV